MALPERRRHDIQHPHIRHEARRLHQPQGGTSIVQRLAMSPEHSKQWADSLSLPQKFRFFMLTAEWPGSHTKAATEMHLRGKLPVSSTIYDRRTAKIMRAAQLGGLNITTPPIK